MASHPVKTPDQIRFGEDYEVDLRSYELRRAGRPLKLERIPMELLLLLTEERGQLVTRDQIIERIWRFRDGCGSLAGCAAAAIKPMPIRSFTYIRTTQGLIYVPPV